MVALTVLGYEIFVETGGWLWSFVVYLLAASHCRKANRVI